MIAITIFTNDFMPILVYEAQIYDALVLAYIYKFSPGYYDNKIFLYVFLKKNNDRVLILSGIDCHSLTPLNDS